jgi:5-formyltetrahydrofolate cyclo-ligase
MVTPARPVVVKDVLRREALARRDALPPSVRATAAEAVAKRPFPIEVPAGAIVSGYSPMKSEFNPVPLMRRLADAGASLALPVVAGRSKPLIMRAWSFGAPLAAGVWGIREPPPEAPEVDPDILLVPLAAFDRRGHRIGYGAGYYDYTFTHLRKAKHVIGAGLAFAVQETKAIPALSHDVPLDFVLTERKTFDFRSS